MKYEFKGTPGKWVLDKRGFLLVKSDSMFIATCGVRTTNINPKELYKEQLANAKIISKAPEMFEMLNKIFKTMDKGNQTYTELKKLLREAT